MTVVGEAGDGVEALALIKEQLPDVVLYWTCGCPNGWPGCVAEVKASSLPIKVIIMTTFESEADVCSLRESRRARDICQKTPLWRKFSTPVRRVNFGDTYLPARIAQKVAKACATLS